MAGIQTLFFINIEMRHQNSYFVYILASKKKGTLYIGVTNNLLVRVYEHKHKTHKGFTQRYDVDKLVYFEETDNVFEAIKREKQLKKWNREWKIRIIEEMNPEWNDLYYDYGGNELEMEQNKECMDSRLRGNDIEKGNN